MMPSAHRSLQRHPDGDAAPSSSVGKSRPSAKKFVQIIVLESRHTSDCSTP
jgi:hypothetical protein